jgi:hypothetical protein
MAKRSVTGIIILTLFSSLLVARAPRADAASSLPAGIIVNGTASIVNGVLRLTTAGDEAGSAFLETPYQTNQSFHSEFQFSLHDADCGGPADGITFVIQSATAGVHALGESGGGLGYQGISPSVAVEFDIWDNGGADPNANHVGIDQNGEVPGYDGGSYLAVATPSFPLYGTTPVYVWVVYDAPSTQLAVFVSSTATKPTHPLVTASVDLAQLLGARAFVGFTGGTGAGCAVQDVLTWSFVGNPLSMTPTTIVAPAGTPFSGAVAYFRDADGNTDPAQYTATIDWGDGSTPTTGTVSSAGGRFEIDGSHTYAQPGAHAVTVTVHDADGATNSVVSAANPPVVSAVSPTSGPASGGTVVTVRGHDFTGASAVDFGAGNPGSDLRVLSDTQLTVTSPPGSGVVDVTVRTGSISSATSSADHFAYIPVVTGVSPSSSDPKGGIPVTITGAGFSGASEVDFGPHHPAPNLQVVSDTTLTVTAPPGSGTVDVRVTTPTGTSPITPADRFTYVPLLFTSDPAEVDAQGNAVAAWTTVLPAPGAGDDVPTPGQNAPFAGVEFDLAYQAGEHVRLSADAAGQVPFCVDGSWTLSLAGPTKATLSGAGSMVGSQCQPSSGQVVDLASLGLPSGVYGIELLLITPASGSTYGTSDIHLIVPPDAAQPTDFTQVPGIGVSERMTVGGTLTLAVGQSGTLTVLSEAAGQPVYGIHAVFGFDPSTIAVTAVSFPSGWSGGVRNNFANGDGGFLETTTSPITTGPILQIAVSCLQAGGPFPLSFSGNYWGYAGNSGNYAWSVSGVATVSCVAPPPSASTTVTSVSIDHTDGSVVVTITGSGLDKATQAALVDATGTTVASTHEIRVTSNGAVLTAHFTSVPAGLDTLKVFAATGTLLASTSGLAVPPAFPLFTITRTDLLLQVPGVPTTHLWRVTNVGTVDGTALLAFLFPGYLSPEPQLASSALPAGAEYLRTISGASASLGWIEYVAVPVAAGASVTIPWTVTLPPDAVFGPNPSVQPGGPIPLDGMVAGEITAAQWSAIAQDDPATIATRIETTGDNQIASSFSWLLGADQAALNQYATSLASSDPTLEDLLYNQGVLALLRWYYPLPTAPAAQTAAFGGFPTTLRPLVAARGEEGGEGFLGAEDLGTVAKILHDVACREYQGALKDFFEALFDKFTEHFAPLVGWLKWAADTGDLAGKSLTEAQIRTGFQEYENLRTQFVTTSGYDPNSPKDWWNDFVDYMDSRPVDPQLGKAIAWFFVPKGESNPEAWVASNWIPITSDISKFNQGLALLEVAYEEQQFKKLGARFNRQQFEEWFTNIVDQFFPQLKPSELFLPCTDEGSEGNSEDPNNMEAQPVGVGTRGWMTPQPLNYVIHFQNDGNAPAHDIRITTTLDSTLDPATLRVGEPDQSSFAGTVVSYNPTTRTITWLLPGINLPPDTTPPAGEGWVSFTVQPQAGVANGTTIAESARVFFDYNPPVATNVVTRTIDTSPPTATLAPLPAVVLPGPLTLTWSGSSPVGIDHVVLYESVDGGTLSPVFVSRGTSATVMVVAGHRYGFAVQAVDGAGLAAAVPTTPQEQVVVIAHAGSSTGGVACRVGSTGPTTCRADPALPVGAALALKLNVTCVGSGSAHEALPVNCTGQLRGMLGSTAFASTAIVTGGLLPSEPCERDPCAEGGSGALSGQGTFGGQAVGFRFGGTDEERTGSDTLTLTLTLPDGTQQTDQWTCQNCLEVSPLAQPGG